MMVLRWWQSHHYPAGGCQRLWEGWLAVIHVFSLYRQAEQVVAGRLKWPRTVLLSLLLEKWVMMAREARSRLLFKILATDSSQDIRTREVCVACPTHGRPDGRLEVPRVSPCAHLDRVGHATCPKEECFVRLPCVCLGVVPTVVNNKYNFHVVFDGKTKR